MKRIFMSVIMALMAVSVMAADKAEQEPKWKATLEKSKGLFSETGISGFMKENAPAYITGDFAEAERPEKKPMSANRNGYYDKDEKWHGGYFDDLGRFVEGHKVTMLFGMPYGLGQLIMIPICPVSGDRKRLRAVASLADRIRRTSCKLSACRCHFSGYDARRRHFVS